MLGKTVLLLLGFLLVVNAHIDIGAKLEGSLDVNSHVADINAKLKGAFAASLDGASIDLDVPLLSVSFGFDTNAFSDGTIEWESDRLTDDGHFESSLLVNGLSLGVFLSINDQTIEGSITTSLRFLSSVSASVKDGRVAFAVENLELSVEDLDIEITGVDQLVTAALDGAVKVTLQGVFKAASSAVTQFGASVVAVVEAPLRDIFEALPRVTVTVKGSVNDFEKDREEFVQAIVQLYGNLDLGDFESGIMIGGVNNAGNGRVDVDFWTIDNDEDGVSGADAAAALEAAYDEDSDLFAEVGLEVAGLKVTASIDGSDAAALAPFWF